MVRNWQRSRHILAILWHHRFTTKHA